jgi:hypothetical protein
MGTVRLLPTALIHVNQSKVMILELTTSELFEVDGDAAEMLKHIQSKLPHDCTIKSIISYLSETSPQFNKNKNKEKTLKEAIGYFESIRVLEYDSNL